MGGCGKLTVITVPSVQTSSGYFCSVGHTWTPVCSAPRGLVGLCSWVFLMVVALVWFFFFQFFYFFKQIHSLRTG